MGKKIHYKTLWLSDIHLGFKDCRADYLLDLLNNCECETLYLLGDIVDLWSLKKSLYWPQSHYRVLQALINIASGDTRVVYIPGNHDEPLRDYIGQRFGDIEVRKSASYRTVAGRRLLMMHGDCLDGHVRLSKWESLIGETAYDFLLFMNRWFNYFRRRSGHGYWSLASYIKERIPNARKVITVFEQCAVNEAQRLGYDGVICGHIHQPALKQIDGLLYCNDGDWIENCTLLGERHDGVMELVQWHERPRVLGRIDSAGEELCAEILPMPQVAKGGAQR